MPSVVWEFFDKGKKGKPCACSICNVEVHYDGSTGALLKHLRRFHENELLVKGSRPGQKDTNHSFDRRGDLSELAIAFSSCNVPFRLIENEHFKNFCTSISDSYVGSSADTMQSRVMGNSTNYKNGVKRILSGKDNLCLISDGWTNSTMSVYSVFVYSVDDNFVRTNKFIGIRQIEGPGTAVNVGITIGEILSEVNLDITKISTSNTDGGSNLQAFCRNNMIENIHCGCHVLNLVLKELCDLPAISQIVRRGSKLAGFLRRNKDELEKFEKTAQLLEVQAETPRNFSSTRWAGAFMLLTSYIGNIRTLGCSPKLQEFQLNAKEIETVNSFLVVTNDLFLAIKKFEKENSYASEIIPEFQAILLENRSSKKSTTKTSRKLYQLMQERLEKYMTNDLVLVATYFDARFVYIPNLCGNKRWDEIEEVVKSFGEKVLDKDDLMPNVPKKRPRMETAIEKFLTKGLNATGSYAGSDMLSEEIAAYRATVVANRPELESDPLEFWKYSRQKLPCLAKMAKVVLSVPASSSETERLFSWCTYLTNSTRRNRLKPTTINGMLHNIAINKLSKSRFFVESSVDLMDDEDSDDDDELEPENDNHRVGNEDGNKTDEEQDDDDGNDSEEQEEDEKDGVEEAVNQERVEEDDGMRQTLDEQQIVDGTPADASVVGPVVD